VIRHFSEIGIGWWTSHDTDVISAGELMTEKQDEILDGIATSLKQYGVQCSMVTGETFFSRSGPEVPQASNRRCAPMRPSA
jgi:xylose isomerase